MRLQDETVQEGIRIFTHNLVATGMKLEELPLLFSKITVVAERLLEEVEHDQTS